MSHSPGDGIAMLSSPPVGGRTRISVEEALILRRLTSADVPTLRPATAEQLEARRKLLEPRHQLSADVIKRKEMLRHVQAQLADASQRNQTIATNFSKRLPLVQLGIDLRIENEKKSSFVTPKGLLQELQKSSPQKSSKAAAGILTCKSMRAPQTEAEGTVNVFDSFKVAKEAATSMNAVDNLLPRVVSSNPYLQHLRDKAENTLRETAGRIVATAAVRAGPSPPRLSDKSDERQENRTTPEDTLNAHHEQIFAEWTEFLSVCSYAENSLSEETKRELFISFMRSKGDEAAAPRVDNAAVDPTQKGSGAPDALDDLMPPSGDSAVVFIEKPKMMLDATQKKHLVQRLVDQIERRDRTNQNHRSGTATVTDEREAIQNQANTVFREITAEQTESMRRNVEKAVERHHQHGLRLNRRKNIDLYREQQREKHLHGLKDSTMKCSATEPAKANRSVIQTAEMKMSLTRSSNISEGAQTGDTAQTGPPSATARLKQRVGSAGSGVSQLSTPRRAGDSKIVVADLPSIVLRKPTNP